MSNSNLGPWVQEGEDGTCYRRDEQSRCGAIANGMAHEAGPHIGRFRWFAMVANGRSKSGASATTGQAQEDADAALSELEAAS